MARVTVQDVSVDFPIYHGNSRSLKQTVFRAASARLGGRGMSGRLGEDRRHRVVVHAVRDVSFTLRDGDRLALVGGNGAGKTTLLRAVAGIYEPVTGSVRVQGSLNALLDPNLGMNPELTGRENIMLRGLYNGLGKAETRRLEEDVEDFAELGEFMDLPVRFFSSGMVVRLGFGLATAIRPRVLLMDEWFLAGDSVFMDKARARLEALIRDAEILVLSSHLEHVVLGWATRAIWLDNGRVRDDGAPRAVLEHYLGRAPEVPTALPPAAEGMPPAAEGGALAAPHAAD